MSTTSAKDARLTGYGSHWVADEYASGRADGISKEEVFPRFEAVWRGKPVRGTLNADRYSAGMDRDSQHLTDWRIYIREAHELDEAKNGGRGAELTETARTALREVLEPLVREWLAGEEYRASFRSACAATVLRHFTDSRYSIERDVTEALATFRDRMTPEAVEAASAALDAWRAYDAALEAARDAAMHPSLEAASA